MARTVNPLKKEIVKKALLQGKSARGALKQAKYTDQTAHQSTNNKCVKLCIEEIRQEYIKLEDVTIQKVINNLYEDRQLAKRKNDISTMARVDELLGKYLAMWTEKFENTVNIADNARPERLSRIQGILTHVDHNN